MFLNACTTQGRGQGLLPTPDVTSSPAFGKLRDVLSSPALTSFPKASWCPVITNLFLKVSQTFPNARSFPNKNHSYSLSQTFKRGRTFPKVSKSLWKCEPFLFAFLILSKTWHSFCSPYLAQYLHNAKSVPIPGTIILSDVLPLVLPYCYHSTHTVTIRNTFMITKNINIFVTLCYCYSL